MASTNETTCSICSKVYCFEGVCIDVNENILKPIILLVGKNVTVHNDSNTHICTTCFQDIHNAYNFKTRLIDIHKTVLPLENTGISSSQIYKICLICKEVVTKSSTESSTEFITRHKGVIDYLSEDLTLKVVQKSRICISCQNSLIDLNSIIKLLAIWIEESDDIELSQKQDKNVHKLEVKLESNYLSYEEFKCKNEELDLEMDCEESEEERKLKEATSKRCPKLTYVNSNNIKANNKTRKNKLSPIKDKIESKIKSELYIDLPIIHKDIKDVKTFMCDICEHKTKRKDSLNKHMRIHKDIDENKASECHIRMFKPKNKKYLKQHRLIHHNIDETKALQCNICGYKTRLKYNLQRHLLKHTNIEDNKVFECDICTFQTYNKYYHKQHLLTHQNTVEINLECNICGLKIDNKEYLKSHMSSHHNDNKLFKCNICDYVGKQKRILTRHMLIHKDISEIEAFECYLCGYKAKRKYQLINHMLVHKNINEIEAFECYICGYKAKLKVGIKKHMVVHQNVNEIQTYECEICGQKIKRKDHLKRHMLIHETFECYICGYKTKRQDILKSHVADHRNRPKFFKYDCIKLNKKN